MNFECRSIDSYNTPIDANEYRVAFRIGTDKDGDGTPDSCHWIMQLSDGSWAGKAGSTKSYHFTESNIDPHTYPGANMWADIYPASGGTIYFAVTRPSY